MGIAVERISAEQAEKVIHIEEGQFSDVKAIEIAPAKLSKHLSAFANADGGELYIGIDNQPRAWRGFTNPEAASGHIQAFEKFFPLGTDFQYEFLRCDSSSGLVLHIQVQKTKDIRKATNGIAYVRRGSSSNPVETDEAKKHLEYLKGVSSFEDQTTSIPIELVTESDVVKDFMRVVVPTQEPLPFLKRQVLVTNELPTVASLLLFSDEPQAAIPKRCGIKVYRYKTTDAEGFREVLAFTPKTVEGPVYKQIKEAVKTTVEIVESIPKVGVDSLEYVKYPHETIHEIITNAVIHRDYNITDDVHIRIFDNRVEIFSPGRLPAHITIENILKDRAARNPRVMRMLNKFPDPPNQDVGEGLNTAYRAMTQLGLKPFTIAETDSGVLVTIRHEMLASPEEAILDYLATHECIKNADARTVCHIQADHRIKTIFGRMVEKGLIEQVPGTRTSNTAYRLPAPPPPPSPSPSSKSTQQPLGFLDP